MSLQKMFLILGLLIVAGCLIGGCTSGWTEPVKAGSYFAEDAVHGNDSSAEYSAFEVDTGQTCLILGSKILTLKAETGFVWVDHESGTQKTVCLERVLK